MGNDRNLDLAYPIWAEVFPASGPGPSDTMASGLPSSVAGGTALASISDVLAWRVRPGDAQGILRALQQAFTFETNAAGKRVLKWNRQSYRPQAVEAGMGALTGPQASIYERSKTIVDQIRALLGELTSLTPAPDEEDVAAVEALILPQLADLVDQFGAEGGPMPQRVDTIFQLLLGVILDPAKTYTFHDPDDVEGLFGMLREELGLTEDNVNTLHEEKQLTKFRLAVNYADMLMIAWHHERDKMDRTGSDVFFGTQIVRLQRVFSAMAVSVQEVYRALNSVFLGPAERLTLELHTDPPITVAELLQWIDELATTRAFEFLQFGGKTGAENVLVPTLARLNALFVAMTPDADRYDDYPDGFRTARVRAAIQEMAGYLETALDLANNIHRTPVDDDDDDKGGGGTTQSVPKIISVTPSGKRAAGTDETFTIATNNVTAAAQINLVKSGSAPINATSVDNTKRDRFIAVIALPATASDGWKIRVIDGGTTIDSTETIDVVTNISQTDAPKITSAPNTLKAFTTRTITIKGEGFNNAIVELVRGRKEPVRVVSQTATEITAETNIQHWSIQDRRGWTLRVTNANGKSADWPVVIWLQ